jgi:hypothetical protein
VLCNVFGSGFGFWLAIRSVPRRKMRSVCIQKTSDFGCARAAESSSQEERGKLEKVF